MFKNKISMPVVASSGGGGISVIELTDKNGTIASTQLGEINANPQNFAFKYNGKILLFTKADSTTYQYCNNTTSSSENNVMTTSTLLTITSSTGVYTIAENVHNVVANSIHPADGGDLTNIQVGSKVYSIPSGGGGTKVKWKTLKNISRRVPAGDYYVGQELPLDDSYIIPLTDDIYSVAVGFDVVNTIGTAEFAIFTFVDVGSTNKLYIRIYCIKDGKVGSGEYLSSSIVASYKA